MPTRKCNAWPKRENSENSDFSTSAKRDRSATNVPLCFFLTFTCSVLRFPLLLAIFRGNTIYYPHGQTQVAGPHPSGKIRRTGPQERGGPPRRRKRTHRTTTCKRKTYRQGTYRIDPGSRLFRRVGKIRHASVQRLRTGQDLHSW